MNYKLLGKSDLRVSEISFGCMSLGDNHQENARLLHHALDQGINFFDTADLYQKGENEISVGKAFKNMRDKVVLATKVGNQWQSNGSGWDWNPRKSYILEAVDKSLERLQTDYIDLYQLHGGTIEDPIDETIEAFELLKAQGKIRHYGISSIRPNVIREWLKRAALTSVMMQYSLLDRRPEETCLDLLAENQVDVLARGSLAQGLLAGKPAKAYLNYAADEVAKAAQAVKAVAGTERSAAEVAVKFALYHPAVSSAVMGIRTATQLEESIQIGQASPLAKTDVQTLSEAIQANQYEQHR